MVEVIYSNVWFPNAENPETGYRLTIVDIDQSTPGLKRELGQHMLGYKLERVRPPIGWPQKPIEEGDILDLLFMNVDFGVPITPRLQHTKTSLETIHALMCFLTIKPGGIASPEFFADYTEAQLAFCEHDADALMAEVDEWYGQMTELS